ncbi:MULTISPECIES: DUF1543 domain-containing protein [Aphanothece]|uniref:DUF1543 domain-containing protein n=1 Tax=Aphanothece TaxID=1121 RepID=UPI0039856513
MGSRPCPERPPGAPAELFLVVLGGRVPGCNLELHDVRFVAGATIEATLPLLRRQWFGSRRGLHIDSYVAVRHVDGYRVELRPERWAGAERLYFVNLGGYDPGQLAEQHRFGLEVAPSPQAAVVQAKRRWQAQVRQRHRDDLVAVDDCLTVDQLSLFDGLSLHVHLTPESQLGGEPLVPDWFGYRLI